MRQDPVFRLGFWSSVFVALLGAVYLVLLIGYFATEGFAFPPTPFVQFVGGIVTFLTVPGLVILFAAVRFAKDGEGAIFGTLGIVFITLFAATVSINRFVQLTVIRQSAPAGDLARFLPYATDSVMFALEMLGWGFFSSLAAVSIAPLFASSRFERRLRALLFAYALFSSTGAIGYAVESPISAGAFVAWGPILLALAIMFAVYFRRAGVAQTQRS
jgi:hypothetical protein